MRLAINHETTYTFSSEVFLEPHYLRFHPKTTPFQSVVHFDLAFSPDPAGKSFQVDPEGNLVHFVWFDGMTRHLKITASSLVESESFNPFNFLISPPEFLKVPFYYPIKEQKVLHASLQTESLSPELTNYGKQILVQAKNHTVNFILQVTRQIHNDFLIEERLFGAPMTPEATFKLKKGSCRDVSWMLIQVLRHFGIAARFVSGYFFIDEEVTSFELHGWLEVYLPGGGWIGLDPSHGILTGDHHVPLVSSAYHAFTLPVTGATRGDSLGAISTRLEIKKQV